MHPTMNTRVEKFAFGMAIFFMILLPALWYFVPFSLFLLLEGQMEPEQIKEIVLLTMVLFFLSSVVFFPLMCLACSIWIESSHFKALAEAEKELSDMVISDLKTLPPNWHPNGAVFVCENVAIANDYFKSFLWYFRKIIGGRSRSFERLVERGRREATVRLLRKAKECGANVVWNVRYETSIIRTDYSWVGGSSDNSTKSMAGIEMIAYGTAFSIPANSE
ncbi:MAG: YbjQ family protein [Planctomycetaceae bacterium]|jgi:uncharacterized protein YbjQ (UPF0145 family)|nr:YbjQ family protein [Planctomycetaceae bacterium]